MPSCSQREVCEGSCYIYGHIHTCQIEMEAEMPSSQMSRIRPWLRVACNIRKVPSSSVKCSTYFLELWESNENLVMKLVYELWRADHIRHIPADKLITCWKQLTEPCSLRTEWMSADIKVSPCPGDGKGVDIGDGSTLSFSFSVLGAAHAGWNLCHRVALGWLCHPGHCTKPRTVLFHLSTKVICVHEVFGFKEYLTPANSGSFTGILNVLTQEELK